MFVSWINIAGRIFVTPPVQDFTCYTYPAYKPISNDHYTYNGVPFELVENVDPKYNRLPWANKEGSWAATMLFAPFFGAIAVGMLYLYFTLKDEKVDTRASHAKEEEMITKALVPESKPATPSSSAEPADAPPGRKKSQKKKVRDGH